MTDNLDNLDNLCEFRYMIDEAVELFRHPKKGDNFGLNTIVMALADTIQRLDKLEEK